MEFEPKKVTKSKRDGFHMLCILAHFWFSGIVRAAVRRVVRRRGADLDLIGSVNHDCTEFSDVGTVIEQCSDNTVFDDLTIQDMVEDTRCGSMWYSNVT